MYLLHMFVFLCISIDALECEISELSSNADRFCFVIFALLPYEKA